MACIIKFDINIAVFGLASSHNDGLLLVR